MRYSNQNGSVLLVLAATMVVAAALGTAIFSMNTSVSYSELDFNKSNKALYLAESGIRFANINYLPDATDTTYTLKKPDGSEGDSFKLKIANETIESFGVAGSVQRNLIKPYPPPFTIEPCEIAVTDGLVSIWCFNDPFEPGKDSHGGNDGILGTPADKEPKWISDGISGGALEFDTGDYVRVPHNPTLDLQNAFTISAWINAATGQNDYQVIIAKENSEATQPWKNRNFWLSLWQNTGKLHLKFSSSSNEAEANLEADEDLRGAGWKHVVAVYDGTAEKCFLYIDGKFEKEELNVDYPPQGIGYDMYIGQEYPDYRGVKGIIDELAIFNKALTACEIRAIYDTSCHIGCDAVAYYPFNGNTDDESGADQEGRDELNGTPANDAALTADRFSCSDKAYTFDGIDDYIHVSDDDALDLSTEGTLAAWIFIHSYNDLAGIIHKGDKGDFSDEAYSLQFWVDNGGNDGKKRILFALTDDSGNTYELKTPGNFHFNIGLWYHVAATWDSTGMKLYVDGSESNSNKNVVTVRNTDGGLNIGSQLIDGESYGSYGNCPFDGKIDDAVIYDRALSAGEISAMAEDRP
jgi:hypothetical protein